MPTRDQPPSAKRLQLARAAGLVAWSPLLTAAAAIAVLLAMDGIAHAGSQCARLAADCWTIAGQTLTPDANIALRPAVESACAVIRSAAPLLSALAAAALLANFAQIGPVFSLGGGREARALSAGRAGAANGGGGGGVRAALFRGLLSTAVIAAVCAWFLWSQRAGILLIADRDPPAMAHAAHAAIRSFLIALAAALALAGAADLLFARWALHNRLSMTRAEVEAEERESSGDASLAAARRQAYQQRLFGIELLAVPRASVLVIGTGFACALRYDGKPGSAPIILAAGKDEQAAAIKYAAQRAQVEVVHDPALARALVAQSVGEPIDESSYPGVSAALNYARSVMALRGETPAWDAPPIEA